MCYLKPARRIRQPDDIILVASGRVLEWHTGQSQKLVGFTPMRVRLPPRPPPPLATARRGPQTMKKYKKDLEVSYSIGAFPTIELLENHPETVEHILISTRAERNVGVDKIKAICKAQHITTELADGAIRKISDSDNCYAVGIFKKYKSPLEKGNHLVLVNPDDKGNLGANIRSMLAYGVTNLAIIRPAADIFDPRVVRASMGAVFKLNVAYYGSFSDYHSNFKTNNLYAFMSDGKTELKDVKFEKPFSLVFGNEASGLGPAFHNMATSVRIPQTGQVDSLNLSVAVGIGLYASSV